MRPLKEVEVIAELPRRSSKENYSDEREVVADHA